MHVRRIALASTLLFASVATAQTKAAPPDWKPSATYQLLDLALEATAREIERVGARPTINSRELFLITAALYDAWAPFDATAVSSHGELPRQKVRTDDARRRAMVTALGLVLHELYPAQKKWLDVALRRERFVPNPTATTPEYVGALAAKQLIEKRRRDGANQLGDEPGGDGQPYGDYTYYSPLNPPTQVFDPNRGQSIPFTMDDGKVVRPGFLTPHWYRVTPFALTSPAQFRPPPPPLYGTPKLKEEVDEVIHYNATLTPEQKALVEFMRDGPQSTGQSGHWLRFAQAVSRRDSHDLDRDVKVFFSVAAACFDAFIAAWEAKRFYDSSRPYTLVRHLYAGKKVRGWLGPGKGVGEVAAESWMPYSPRSFVTPPFPGYVSGHSTVSAAGARTLELFTGSDVYDEEESRRAGDLTENGASHALMMSVDGRSSDAGQASCDVTLRLPTFSKTAELAGISRVMGGYHIQSDNTEGLKLGRKVADTTWTRLGELFSGKPAKR